MELTAVDPKEREYNLRLTATELADLAALASQMTGSDETSVRRTTDKVYEAVRGITGMVSISIDNTFDHARQAGYARKNIDDDGQYKDLLARLR